MGPWSYAKHLTSGARLPFTAAYFGSIALTLYFAIGVSKSIYVAYFFCHSKTKTTGFCVFHADDLSLPHDTFLPFSCLSHLALPQHGKYGRTAQPEKGGSCSLRIHRAVQPEATLYRICLRSQPFQLPQLIPPCPQSASVLALLWL
jgi:hypothetical protein